LDLVRPGTERAFLPQPRNVNNQPSGRRLHPDVAQFLNTGRARHRVMLESEPLRSVEQLTSKLSRIRLSIRCLLLERMQDDALDVFRNRRNDLARRVRWNVRVFLGDLS